MQARGILADVVTCCSLINALERGGQWQLAEQLFVQMCAASRQRHSTNSPFYRMMEIAAAAAEDNPPLHPSEGHPRDLNAAAPQGWGSPHQHAGIGSSPQTVRHPSTPQPRLVPPLQVTSPVQLSSGTNPQASLQSRFQSMPEFPATNFPRTSPARHVSDLQQQISNLSSDNSNSMLQFSLSTPDVTNFHNAQSSTVDADSFYSRPYQPHSTLSASSSRMRGSEGSLSSLQSQSSPLKFAPATPEKPSTPQQHVSDNLTSLMQDFASMQMQPAHLLSSQQCTHMPLDTSNSGPITEATLFSHATAKKFQEAAAQRQDTLSLRPTTHPVGHGQGPVLRFMNVTQVAPNRVCCNALLAAYARAKPTQWQKVSNIGNADIVSCSANVQS